MPSPFVKDDLIEVVVQYVTKKMPNGIERIFVVDDNDKDTKARYEGSIEKVTTMWCHPNWKEHTDAYRKAHVFDYEAGEKKFDWPLYRSMCLETFMKKWDIVDADGKGIPCVKDNIQKLDPKIGNALIDGFLAKTTFSDVELGN